MFLATTSWSVVPCTTVLWYAHKERVYFHWNIIAWAFHAFSYSALLEILLYKAMAAPHLEPSNSKKRWCHPIDWNCSVNAAVKIMSGPRREPTVCACTRKAWLVWKLIHCCIPCVIACKFFDRFQVCLENWCSLKSMLSWSFWRTWEDMF